MAERGPTATLHLVHTSVAQHVTRVWIGPGARDLESTVTHGFVKHGFKVLLHRVVDGPLQASRCLVLQSLNEPRSSIPGIPVYFGPKSPWIFPSSSPVDLGGNAEEEE